MAIPASNARENLFPLIAQVNENSSAVHITSKSGNAVLISESEYESLIETLHLFSTPANTKAILQGIEDVKSGRGVTFSNMDEATEYFSKNKKAVRPMVRRAPKKAAKKRVARKK